MDQKRYIDFKDMFDGGGPGKMGDTFEGGGLLSMIANMVADPYGSKDPERRKERMKALGLLDTGMDMSTPPAATVVEPVVRTGPAPSYATMDMGEAGRGANNPVGETTLKDASYNLIDRYGYDNLYSDPRARAEKELLWTLAGRGLTDEQYKYLMPPTAGIMDQVRGAANPIADMPAMDFMDMLRSQLPAQTVPFGGYQQPTPYSDMIARLKEMGIDANNMPAEQLQQLMLTYSRGGPFAYGRGM